MALTFNFNFGRLLGRNEKLTTAKFNGIVKGISATLAGVVGNGDLGAGAVSDAKVTPDAYWYALASLVGGTYVGVWSPAVTGYADGLALAFKPDVSNAGGCNLDAGPGAKPLTKLGGVALLAGDLRAGAIVLARYNADLVAGGGFEILSQLVTSALADGYLTADATGRAKMGDDYVNPAKTLYGATVLGTAGAVTIDWSVALTVISTLTANITFDFSNAKPGQSLLIAVTQAAAGNKTVSWTPAIKWRNGVTPVLTVTANKTDVFAIVYLGGSFYGNVTQNY